MDLIIACQFRSTRAYTVSKGDNVLSDPDMLETTLEELSEMVKHAGGTMTVSSSGGAVIISNQNSIDIEMNRTTVTCNRSDRKEVLKVLTAAAARP